MNNSDHADTETQSELKKHLDHLRAQFVDADDDEAEAMHALMKELDFAAAIIEHAEQRQEIIDEQHKLIDAQRERIDLLTTSVETLESDLYECRSITVHRNQR